MPLVTVILCTRNRCGLLRDALESLAALETDGRFEYEVLVVDNGSTDATPEVIAEAALTAPVTVRSILEREPGVVPARNRGVGAARGEWIAFFDDDQLADPRWLAELFAIADRKNARCVGGSVLLDLPPGTTRNLSPVCRMLLGETVGLTEPQPYTARITPGCGNLMLHRSVFDAVGLFDERMADRGEDTDLFLRMHGAGIAGWFTPVALVHHRIPAERLTDAFLLKLAERMANGMAEDERLSTGPRRYPFVWCARVAQTAFVLWPKWLFARLTFDREGAFGAKCRLRIARRVLRDGLRLIVTAQARPRLPAGTATTPTSAASTASR